MFKLLAASAAFGLALAAPAPNPQDIDFDLAYALPEPTFSVATDATAQIVSYNPTTIFQSAVAQITTTIDVVTATDASDGNIKRAACDTQPAGYGPTASPDTPSAFLSLTAFSDAANNAPIPSGYVQAFQNLQASNNAYGYLGFTNLKSYDSNACAAKCNAINGCLSFNLYFERDPTLTPGSSCTNPASTTNIKCVFWGGPVTADNAVNNGQYREQFQVVIAGSNGYVNSSLATPPGYSQPVYLGNAAINAPYDSYGANTFLGSSIFNSGPFNVSLCAQACTLKSQYAIAHPPTDGSPVQTCQFFNTYILYINNTNHLQGQYCAMYSETWPKSYATNVGQYRGNDHFLIEYSFAFSNATNPGTACATCAIAQASQAISYSTLQPFCSSLLGYTTPLTTSTVISTITPTAVVTTTTTDYSTIVVSTTTTLNAKRDVQATTVITTNSIGLPALAVMTPAAAVDRRATIASTPAALTQYPASIVSSACSLQATPVTLTSTIYQSTTTTAPTLISTTTTTVDVIDVTVAVVTITPTSTPAITPGQTFNIAISNSNTPADGQLVRGQDTEDNIVGAGGGFNSYPAIPFKIDAQSGKLYTSDGARLITAYVDGSWVYDDASNPSYAPITCTIGKGNVLSCTASLSAAAQGNVAMVSSGGYYLVTFQTGGSTVLTAMAA